MKSIFAISLICISYGASAQTSESQIDVVARGRMASESALSQAKAAQAAAASNSIKILPGATIPDLKNASRADPLAIASAYKAKDIGRQKPQQNLLIFVSTSMPKPALLLLGRQAERAGAIIVLRGLVGTLGQPGAMTETIKAMEPVASTGADVQIDPQQFLTYDVKSVPTFVLAKREEGCVTDQCASSAFSLVGDVSLEYALETWVKRGGRAGKLAEQYLARLER